MFAKEVTIQNASGFHVRPAQLFIEKANEYQSQIKLRNQAGAEADTKSILGLMMLGLEKGAQITIEAEGSDEEEAVKALVGLVESKFGEE